MNSEKNRYNNRRFQNFILYTEEDKNLNDNETSIFREIVSWQLKEIGYQSKVINQNY